MKTASRSWLSLLLALALLPFAFAPALAGNLSIPVPTPTTLDQLLVEGAYIPFSDSVALSEFTYTKGPNDMPAPEQINVTTRNSDTLRFNGPFLDTPGGVGNGVSDGTISFTVENTAGGLFTGVTLGGNPSVGPGTGFAVVTETIFGSGLPEPIQLDILSAFQPTEMPIILETSQTFSSPIPSFKIVKDILLRTTHPDIPATLSVIDQKFVPEPTGLCLAFFAFLGLGVLRRRQG